MIVHPINISNKAIKDAIIRALNEINETSLEVDLDTLSFVHGSDSHLTLLESGTRNGVLVNKISLNDLFPKNLDIRPFRGKKIARQIKSDYEPVEAQALVDSFNKFRNLPLLKVAPEGYTVSTDIDEDVFRDFMLFCHVHGFWELDFQNAVITKQNDIMYISPVQTHPIYTGSLEVLV